MMSCCEGRALGAAHTQCLEHLMDFQCLKPSYVQQTGPCPQQRTYMKSMHMQVMQAPKERDGGQRNSSS